MNNTLMKITVFDKDKKSSEIPEVTLEIGKGLPGDRHYKDASNQISILIKMATESDSDGLELNSAENEGKGLCHARFRPNLLIYTNENPDLKAGDEIHIGDTVLKLTQPKHCFDECPLVQGDEYCHLKTGAGFVEVIRGGTITVEP